MAAAAKWTKDTVAVVTGSNKGIGYEIVRGLAKAGLTVVLTSRDETQGKEATDKLAKEDLHTVYHHQLNVDSTESVKGLASWLVQQFGEIDILVNNAGIYLPDVSHENAVKTLETNYWGVQNVTQGLLPLLAPTGLKRIINVSSQLGQLKRVQGQALREKLDNVSSLTHDGVEALAHKYLRDVKAGTVDEWTGGFTQYSESKVLLNAWTRVIAKTLSKKQISVNAICPGFTSTALNSHAASGKTPEEGADTAVWLALLPVEDYPTGKFFVGRKAVDF